MVEGALAVAQELLKTREKSSACASAEVLISTNEAKSVSDCLAVPDHCFSEGGDRTTSMVASIAAAQKALDAQKELVESVGRDIGTGTLFVASAKHAQADCASRIKQGQDESADAHLNATTLLRKQQTEAESEHAENTRMKTVPETALRAREEDIWSSIYLDCPLRIRWLTVFNVKLQL